jgi:hypothetical protein
MSVSTTSASLPANNSSDLRFHTNTLHFAIWLIVERLLEFDRVIMTRNKATFVFRDPEERGGSLLSQWLSSDPLVPQKATLEVTRMLRTQMTALQANGGAQ